MARAKNQNRIQPTLLTSGGTEALPLQTWKEGWNDVVKGMMGERQMSHDTDAFVGGGLVNEVKALGQLEGTISEPSN
jgi:hypothetical protein